MMRVDLPQVVVPKTYSELTTRRVLTSGWLDGEKLSQSKADDVGTLVNVGVICFLKQLLEHGFFHAGADLMSCDTSLWYLVFPYHEDCRLVISSPNNLLMLFSNPIRLH